MVLLFLSLPPFTGNEIAPYKVLAILGAIEESFDADVDFAQIIKICGKPDKAGPDWTGPPRVIENGPKPSHWIA
jgi:hypothetical protein